MWISFLETDLEIDSSLRATIRISNFSVNQPISGLISIREKFQIDNLYYVGLLALKKSLIFICRLDIKYRTIVIPHNIKTRTEDIAVTCPGLLLELFDVMKYEDQIGVQQQASYIPLSIELLYSELKKKSVILMECYYSFYVQILFPILEKLQCYHEENVKESQGRLKQQLWEVRTYI